MAATRRCIKGEMECWTYTNDTLTGNLAATDIDNGDTIPAGMYMVWCNVRLNANVATATITAITVGGQNILAMIENASFDGAQAADTQLSCMALVHIATAGAQIATTTANSPQYDLSIAIVRVQDALA